jgi:hypothetical protein
MSGRMAKSEEWVQAAVFEFLTFLHTRLQASKSTIIPLFSILISKYQDKKIVTPNKVRATTKKFLILNLTYSRTDSSWGGNSNKK